MKKQLSTIFGCLSAILLLGTESHAQINLLQDYANNKSAALGTYKAIAFREGGFSSLYPIPNTDGKEFWTISDRGVNVDCANANLPACRPGYDKMYAFPSYAPKIHRIRLNGDSIQILQTITMKRPNGTTATGVLNPTGFGSKATEEASMDTVTNCANILSKQLAKDIWAIDSEGLVVDAAGNFWISEEGGPTIWKLNPNGVVVKRFTPYANLAGAQPEDVQIDTVFKYRKNNRGFESLAMTPNGKLYAIIQSPLLFPSQAIGEATAVHRILEIDLATNATRVMVYLNDGVIGTSGPNQIRFSDWKIGDMAAINNNEFLVIEAATRGTTDIKKIYKINISGATAVTSDLYSGTSVEGLVNASGLSAKGITPVTKTLFLDLKANGWPAALDKSEGLAIINDSTIVVGNDNDYGQSSPSANGIPTATGNLSHILKYGLKGSNKISNYQASATYFIYGATAPSTSVSPYLLPIAEDDAFTSILTAGETVGSYKMAGLPDGLGAYDNNNGTFTILMNHEMNPGDGAVHAHGSKGAFVSKWVVNKTDLSVVSGSDLIQTVNLWNPATSTYSSGTTAFNRFCSADLPEVSAFYNSTTGLGTEERIFMNGEESGNEGRAFGHIATGSNAGVTYELPALGKFSWENSVASPQASDKTVVVGLDDSGGGQVYIYVGSKTNSGSEVEKAGLTNGKLYGVVVSSYLLESNANLPAANATFTLADLGDVRNMTGSAINTASNNAGVTGFLRPEDGAWDPKHPNDFYFATTNAIGSPSRLWRLRFSDVTNPETGGTITAVLDGTEGQEMLDNLTIDQYGHILLVEDVGGNAHIGKTWQYNISTDELKQVATHDETRFLTGGANFLTQDEEASGILDVEKILGPGYFIVVDQAHYSIPGDVVQGGQLLSFFNSDTYNASLNETGPSTSTSPYLLPTVDGGAFTSILTAGETVGSYKMAGLPDGLGAYDNNNGTFTILMNHEMNPGDGAVHAHGSKGAFVSKWVVNKTDLSVVSGSDLIQTVNLWNPATSTYSSGTTAFNRFCSADLPEVSAFYNSTTGLGTEERIFMNGEESGNEGRAFGHIATGSNAGVTYELPALGKFSWENSVASPQASDKTVVVGLDDSGGGQVYIYVGSKTNSGSEVEKAGLTNGKLYGVVVSSYLLESNASLPAANATFTLADLGDVRNMTGSAINTASNNAGVTGFLRPEDGAWDPKHPNDFYFATTNAIGSPSRLWRLRFSDVTNPETGGTITAVLDGTEGQEMLDNLTIDQYGHILLVEDVGGNAHIGKTWQYNISTDELKQVATHDETRFLTGGANFLTQDEEASGILDVEKILGPGYFIVVDQAHYSIAGDVVQGGQLLSFFNPDTYKASQLVTDVHSSLPESNVYLYPNPTSGNATVSIRLDKPERVVINIFDLQGKEILTVIDATFDQGEQEMTLPTAALTNGIYLVQITSGTSVTRIRTVVLH